MVFRESETVKIMEPGRCGIMRLTKSKDEKSAIVRIYKALTP